MLGFVIGFALGYLCVERGVGNIESAIFGHAFEQVSRRHHGAILEILTRVYFVLALVAVTGIGWLRLRFQLKGLRERVTFCQNYRQKLGKYVASQGRDFDAYGDLTFHSVRMQQELGSLGMFSHYKPAGQNIMLGKTAALLNLLPELHRRLNDPLTEINRIALTNAAELADTLEEMLIRNLGVLDTAEKALRSGLHNPLRLFQAGVQSLLLLPGSVLFWFGLAKQNRDDGWTQKRPFLIMSGILGLIAFAADFVGIVVGWHPFVEIVQTILKPFLK